MRPRRGLRWSLWLAAVLLLAACRPSAPAAPTPPGGEENTPTPAATTLPTPLPPFNMAGVSVDVYPEEDDQASYLAVYLNLYNDFFSYFGIAQNEGAEWVNNPLEVALRFQEWPPAEPNCSSRKVYYLPGEDSRQVTIILVLSGCPDETISEMELRVELQQVESYWNIKWAGKMWKCSRSEYAEYRDNWNLFPCP